MIRLGYSGSNVSHNLNSGKELRGDVTKRAVINRLKTNIEASYTILSWNHARRIPLFRLGLHFISRWDDYDYELMLSRVGGQLDDMRVFIEDCGMRVTMHAIGSLGNPNYESAQRVVRLLTYCSKILERLCPDSGIIVIHPGGTFRNATATFKRIKGVVSDMPDSVRKRIGFENDDIWDVPSVIRLTQETGTTFVYDIHHHKLYPGGWDFKNENIKRALEWTRRMASRNGFVPKVHISSQHPHGVVGKHADFIDYRDYARLRTNIAQVGTTDWDVMIEAGGKEEAVIELRNSVSARKPAWAVKQGHDYL